MKPSKNVRTKIAVGYALIIVVCILSVGYVYRQVERFTGPDDSRMQDAVAPQPGPTRPFTISTRRKDTGNS